MNNFFCFCNDFKQQLINFVTKTLQKQITDQRAVNFDINRKRMSKVQISPQSLTRGHSFINRSAHSALVVSNKKQWNQIVAYIQKKISSKRLRTNSNKLNKKQNGRQSFKSQRENSNNIKCLKIQQCQFGQIPINQQDDIQIHKNQIKKDLIFYRVSRNIHLNLFKNLTKLIITKSDLFEVQFTTQQLTQIQGESLLPNLQQIDFSNNKLRKIPDFLIKSTKLSRIQLQGNQITLIPNQLSNLQQLTYLGVLNNPISEIGQLTYAFIQNNNTIFQIQWKIDFILKQKQSNSESVPSVRTNSFRLDRDETYLLGFSSCRNSKDFNQELNKNINVRQFVKQTLSNSDSKFISWQIDVIVNCQHITYLNYISQFIQFDKCKQMIQICFTHRRYNSLSFLLKLYKKMKMQQFNKVECFNSKITQFNKNSQIVSQKTINLTQCKKTPKIDKQNIVGDKKIKMLTLKTNRQRQIIDKNHKQTLKLLQNFNQRILQPIAKSTKSISVQKIVHSYNFRSDSERNQTLNDFNKEKFSNKTTTILTNFNCTRDTQCQNFVSSQLQFPKYSMENSLNLVQAKNQYLHNIEENHENLLLHHLVTYNIQNVENIQMQMLTQINKDQFIWLLNQLQFIHKEKSINQIHRIFESQQIRQISNQLINTEAQLQNIINSITYKKSIKLLIMHTFPRFLCHYNFASYSILKTILSLDDFQLFQFLQKNCTAFIKVLFKNIPILPTNSYNQCSHDRTRLGYNCLIGSKTVGNQEVSWKLLTNPFSKLYKYIYKKHKTYIKNQLQINNQKSWHFPEYILPQSLIIRNDVHDYQVLQEYQQFQSSFHRKDFKLYVKEANKQNNFSIAKKIYKQVIDQVKASVRNIGKTKQKQSKSLLASPKNLICKKSESSQKIIIYKSQKQSPLNEIKLQKSPIQKLRILSSNQKFQKSYNYSKRNSIRLISNQKTNKVKQFKSIKQDRRKQGISVCSSSVASIKQISDLIYQNKQKTERKTIYIDLSKNTGSVSNNKQIYCSKVSPYDNIRSCTNNHEKYNILTGNKEIQCSTFDQN